MKEHNTGIDLIRIFAGCGVILLHVADSFVVYPPYSGVGGTAWWILNCIDTLFRSSVPLFVMISGYLLLKNEKKFSPSQFYKRRFTKIGIPTVLWILFYLFVLGFRGEITSLSSLAEHILTLNLLHLYFLILILELYLITPLFQTVFVSLGDKGHRYLILGSFILMSIVTATNSLFPSSAVHLESNIATVFIPFIFYFLLGPYFKNIRLSASSIISLLIVLFYLTIFIAIISLGRETSYTRSFTGIPVVILSIISFLLIYQLNFLRFFQRERVKKVFAYLSSCIFGVYLVHVLVLFILDAYYPIIPGHVPSPIWIFVLLKVVIVLFFSFLITAFIKKLPLSRYLIS